MRHALLAAVTLLYATAPIEAQSGPTIEQFMSPASPLELVAAKRADRIAWVAYERGMRNVYTAAAPNFQPVRLTQFLDDDGVDVSGVQLSDDGAVAVFIRGSAPNRQGWVANPSHDPDGAEQAIWAVRTAGGTAWRLAEGNSPALAPDGSSVVYVKDGQIYRARIRMPNAVPDSMDRGLKPFIKAWGRQSSPRWSPDGAYLAFVSSRGDHSFIGVYDVRARRVRWVSPGVDCDSNPMWSPDGKQIAFVRRPGTPFGAQPAPGTMATGAMAACGGTGPQRTTAVVLASSDSVATRVDGLYSAAFENGSRLAIMVANVADLEKDIMQPPARALWYLPPGDRTYGDLNRLSWQGRHFVFQSIPEGDEWERYFAIDIANPTRPPVQLTTTNGLIENAESVAFSSDGGMLYYTTNANDIERRHIWAVPTAGGEPKQLSTGDGIETHPRPLASGRHVAVLYYGAKQPASVALLPANGGDARIIFPALPKDFPLADHVVPQIVKLTAPDGVEFSNQIFLPKDLKPGEKRPAIVFVHGGPARQMLPGYHYMQFYHWAYAANQWLASQGYIVLSVNYRSGVGYGQSFRRAQNTNRRGNSEYQDVLAAGRYLQSRPDVDPQRVGIWGLSYGGLLTAQALARNSDVFVAGVDMAGVHLYGDASDTTTVAYRSSAISAIDTWKSPVLLVHGDDDRNVAFTQTVGLVQLLRARNIYHELIIIPDDLHESMLHSRWMYTWERMGEFLRRFVRDREN